MRKRERERENESHDEFGDQILHDGCARILLPDYSHFKHQEADLHTEYCECNDDQPDSINLFSDKICQFYRMILV